jgi:hypothetical protein
LGLLGVIPQVTLYSLVNVRTAHDPHFALTKNRPDAGRLAWCISEAESGVADCHCYRSVFPTYIRVKRSAGLELWVTETRVQLGPLA